MRILVKIGIVPDNVNYLNDKGLICTCNKKV